MNAQDSRSSAAGFSLLEVLIAVAILAISLVSLAGAQADAIRATAYSRDLTAAAFLAEGKLIDIEWEVRRNGWQTSDQRFDGDFSQEGRPNFRYACLVDFLELPEYSALADAKTDSDKESGRDDGVADTGEQSFGMLGLIWPQIKGAVEAAIRKASCKVTWKDGELEHDFEVATFWTHPDAMANTSEFLRNAAMQAGSEEEDAAAGAGGAGGTSGPRNSQQGNQQGNQQGGSGFPQRPPMPGPR